MSTVIWVDNWPAEGFKDTALATLSYVTKTKEELYALDADPRQDEMGLAGLRLQGSMAKAVANPHEVLADQAIRFHADMKAEIADYSA